MKISTSSVIHVVRPGINQEAWSSHNGNLIAGRGDQLFLINSDGEGQPLDNIVSPRTVHPDHGWYSSAGGNINRRDPNGAITSVIPTNASNISMGVLRTGELVVRADMDAANSSQVVTVFSPDLQVVKRIEVGFSIDGNSIYVDRSGLFVFSGWENDFSGVHCYDIEGNKIWKVDQEDLFGEEYHEVFNIFVVGGFCYASFTDWEGDGTDKVAKINILTGQHEIFAELSQHPSAGSTFLNWNQFAVLPSGDIFYLFGGAGQPTDLMKFSGGVSSVVLEGIGRSDVNNMLTSDALGNVYSATVLGSSPPFDIFVKCFRDDVEIFSFEDFSEGSSAVPLIAPQNGHISLQ